MSKELDEIHKDISSDMRMSSNLMLMSMNKDSKDKDAHQRDKDREKALILNTQVTGKNSPVHTLISKIKPVVPRDLHNKKLSIKRRDKEEKTDEKTMQDCPSFSAIHSPKQQQSAVNSQKGQIMALDIEIGKQQTPNFTGRQHQNPFTPASKHP